MQLKSSIVYPFLILSDYLSIIERGVLVKASHWVCQLLLGNAEIFALCVLRQCYLVHRCLELVYFIDELGFISTIFIYI